MAINPISLRSAYSQAAQSIEKKELVKKSSAVSSAAEVSDNYSKDLGRKSSAEQSAASGQAAIVTRSQPPPAATPRPSDVLVDNFDYEAPKKDSAELEGYARRYLKVIGDQTPEQGVEKKVKDLVQFYGGNPEREQRFKNFVKELEAGQEAPGSQQKSEVAVA